MLFALGPFRISLDNQVLQSLRDEEEVNLGKVARNRAMTASHFLGAGHRTITLNSVIYKEALTPGGPLQMELIRLYMRTGRRVPLISLSGHFYGFYRIEKLGLTKTHALPNGTFQKITTQITLSRAPIGLSLFGVGLF